MKKGDGGSSSEISITQGPKRLYSSVSIMTLILARWIGGGYFRWAVGNRLDCDQDQGQEGEEDAQPLGAGEAFMEKDLGQ